jgi:hypothetical protein
VSIIFILKILLFLEIVAVKLEFYCYLEVIGSVSFKKRKLTCPENTWFFFLDFPIVKYHYLSIYVKVTAIY